MAQSQKSNLKLPFGMQHVMEIEELAAAHNSHKINCLHPMILDKLAYANESKIAGCTPLLLASHYGDLAAVKRIVEAWGVDVNEAATYYFDPAFKKNDPYSKIEKVTPLFVAASRGHADIVHYLVDKGADVSVKTSNGAVAWYNGLTPLYGVLSPSGQERDQSSFSEERKKRCSIARFLLESGADVSLDSIRPQNSSVSYIWMSRFVEIEELTALIDHGMSVNKNDPDDPEERTLLHYWVDPLLDVPTEEGYEESLAIVKLLLDNGADLHLKNKMGLTPIIQAANGENLKVLDYLLERSDISQAEKIIALELAGAVILGEFRNTSPQLITKAYEYWRQSLHLRQEEGSQKNLEIVRLREWKTSEELENVIRQQRSDQEIQSFLVQLRIFSATSWDTVDFLFKCCIDHTSYDSILCRLSAQSRFGDVLKIQWIMLEVIRSFDPQEKHLWLTTLEIVETLIRTLIHLKNINDPLLNVDTIKTSLELMLLTDQFHLTDRESVANDHHSSHLYHFLSLITMLAGLPNLIDEDSMAFLSELVRRRDHWCDPNYGTLLLHTACQQSKQIDMLSTVDLLLRAGADPNAGDLKGNAPLHYLAKYNPNGEAVARLLLANGAHLDRVNEKRKTASDIWKEKHAAGHNPNAAQMSLRQLPNWLREVPKLLCLSARVIRSYRIPFLESPLILHAFVKLH